MKLYVYIVTTNDDNVLHVGYCTDLKRTIKFYKELPNLELETDYNRLVYVEEHPNEESAINRFNELMQTPREIKEFIIEGVNPEWVELVPGVNFDLI